MKIRLFAGLIVAVVLAACSQSVTGPQVRDADVRFDGTTTTPTDTTTNRTGGTMGSGN